MPGGFIGAGAKTVIPAKAMAKLSMRLVPDMTPAEAFQKLEAYIRQIVPKGCTAELRLIHSGDPFVVSTGNPFIQAATAAMRDVFHKETVFVRGGGSIPIIGDFIRILQTPTLVMGFGLPDDNLHAPNEKFHLPNFHAGIQSILRLFANLAGA
jgi:acetylornithine deacetylase/succinyl-diaminopimelate desuccinylase-like protein